MQLIGAGLPRTATTTQKIALETLGLAPCYHMRDMMADLDKGVRLWRRAYDGDEPWGDVFADARSTVDWPSAFHWRELMDAYPDAKVLLSVRDHESWARSMQDTICQIYFGDSLLHHLAQARYHVDPAWKGWVDLMIDTFWSGRGPFADTQGDSTRMIEKAERWNQEVEATVPSERLLVWEPQGRLGAAVRVPRSRRASGGAAESQRHRRLPRRDHGRRRDFAGRVVGPATGRLIHLDSVSRRARQLSRIR
jgi:hypothetical protein